MSRNITLTANCRSGHNIYDVAFTDKQRQYQSITPASRYRLMRIVTAQIDAGTARVTLVFPSTYLFATCIALT
jgi:hypothetical protein